MIYCDCNVHQYLMFVYFTICFHSGKMCDCFMKRVFSLLLLLTFVFSFSSIAFASETEPIVDPTTEPEIASIPVGSKFYKDGTEYTFGGSFILSDNLTVYVTRVSEGTTRGYPEKETSARFAFDFFGDNGDFLATAKADIKGVFSQAENNAYFTSINVELSSPYANRFTTQSSFNGNVGQTKVFYYVRNNVIFHYSIATNGHISFDVEKIY